MDYKKILTIQDISCVGQCSLTVALPILSACGLETCILPSAVLSTHTAGFKGYTFRDLTEDMPLIKNHWINEGIKFDGIYTGYLGSQKQIEYVKDIISALVKGAVIIDPAMADNGKLYPNFNLEYANKMKSLVKISDIVIPNITEACYLTDSEYKNEYDESYIKDLIYKLHDLGAKTVVLTGVGYNVDKTGVAVSNGTDYEYYQHEKIKDGCHGTGDIYASSFAGAYFNGLSIYNSAVIAANYTLNCIKDTKDDKNHWYGAEFEKSIDSLIKMIRSNK